MDVLKRTLRNNPALTEMSSVHEQIVHDYCHQHVSPQTVPNTWCSNMETAWNVALSTHVGLNEFSIVPCPQHYMALNRNDWMTDAMTRTVDAALGYQCNLIYL